ncbi:MAG: response regulator [Bacteroidetes bacterium]|nr:response regulator [Bacteroidota bacterium]
MIILIVDDSKVVIERLTPALNELPLKKELLIGFNYEEAVQLLKENNIDIAILDVNMPGKSGIDILKFIKENKYPVKLVVIMTEDPTEDKKQLCTNLGADYFLDKFTDFEKIPEIISGYACEPRR